MNVAPPCYCASLRWRACHARGRGCPRGQRPRPEAASPPVTGLDGAAGDVRPLPTGGIGCTRWSDPAQLADWRVVAGPEPQVAEGDPRLRLSQHTRHVAAFLGAVEAAGTCCIREELGAHGHVGVGDLSAAPWRGYWLLMRDGRRTSTARTRRLRSSSSPPQSIPRRRRAHLPLHPPGESGAGAARPVGAPRGPRRHTPPGERAAAGVAGAGGAAGRVAAGRPEAEWLAARPGVARRRSRRWACMRAASRRCGRSGNRASTLRHWRRPKPWWRRSRWQKAPVAAKWIIADAQALADLWQAAEAGAATLKSGDVVRTRGTRSGRFSGTRAACSSCGWTARTCRRNSAASRARSCSPSQPERVRRRRGGTISPSAGAFLRLHGDIGSLAAVRADLAIAQKAGVDVARHRSLVIPRPPTAGQAAPPQPVTGQGRLHGQTALHRGRGGGDAARGAGGGEGRRGLGRPLRVGAARRGGRAVWQALLASRLPHPRAAARAPLPVGPRAVALVDRQFVLLRGRSRGHGKATCGLGTSLPEPGWHWEPYNAASGVDAGSTKPHPCSSRA